MQGFTLRSVVVLASVGCLAALNMTVGVILATARMEAVLLAFAPLVVVALGSLIASNRAVLVLAALGINLFAPLPLSEPLPLASSVQVYLSDVLVLLAIASWVAAWLVSPEKARPSSLRTRVLGWPLLLFGLVLLGAIIHGHVRYGASLFHLSFRILLYSGIALAMTDLKPRDAYRSFVALFYAGTVWQVLVALYGVATGTSATDQLFLTTGGERILAGSTAIFMAGTLLLALLNLGRDDRAGRTALHLLMAGLATFALVYTFQRTTFALVALLVPLFLLVFERVGSRAATFLPLAAPFVAAAALLVPQVDPTLFPTLTDRLTASPSTDASVNWRREAYASVWAQVREAPMTGVGFGRSATFTVNDQRYTIGQDPHNQFLFLWAGGGLLLLTSFLLLLVTCLWEAWRRFRTGARDERRLILWAVSLWFVFLVNSLTGAILTVPHLLLVFWVLMVLPMVVRPGRGAARFA